MSFPPASEGHVSNLRPVTRFITTNRDTDGKATIHSSDHGKWKTLRNHAVAFNVLYTTSEFPSQMNNEEDIKAHEKLVGSGPIGLVNKGGSVCRVVDFAPANTPLMHRTKSLDYGLVLEGEMEMSLDSGEVAVLKRGDVAVQRGTMHGWKNTSTTEWARMMFVLLDCHAVKAGGVDLQESLGEGQDEIPPSNNA